MILSPPNEGSAGSSFVNRTRTVKFPHLVPQMRLGLGTLYLESRCQDRDRDWLLISPTIETRMGQYLVPGPGPSKVQANETKNENFTAVLPAPYRSIG